MAYEFKKLSDVNVIESTNENAHVLAEQGGEIVRIPASSVGGGLPSGGAPYQQLVTDADGVVKWEDRLAYDARPANTTLALGDFTMPIYKISDDIPDFLQDITESTSVNVWLNGSKDTVKFYLLSDEYAFAQEGVVVVAYNDNVEVYSGDRFICTLPERGLYLAKLNETYVEGIAPAGTEEPVITWNGFTGILKTIDPKYIPDIGNSLSVVFMALNAEPDDHGWSCTKVTCNKSVDDIYAAFKSGTNINARLTVQSSFEYITKTAYNLRLCGMNDKGFIFASLGCDTSNSDTGDMYIRPNPVKVVYVVVGNGIAARCMHFSTNSGLE